MISLEQRFMIKDLYRQGISISEIARQTGHDRKTIRSAVQAPLRATPQPRAPKARKLDPYVPYLQERLALGVYNADDYAGRRSVAHRSNGDLGHGPVGDDEASGAAAPRLNVVLMKRVPVLSSVSVAVSGLSRPAGGR